MKQAESYTRIIKAFYNSLHNTKYPCIVIKDNFNRKIIVEKIKGKGSQKF